MVRCSMGCKPREGLSFTEQIHRSVAETEKHAIPHPVAVDEGHVVAKLEVFASNAPAIALFQDAGFAHEGVKRWARYRDGVCSDIECMALVIEEPKTSRSGQPLLGSREANP